MEPMGIYVSIAPIWLAFHSTASSVNVKRVTRCWR